MTISKNWIPNTCNEKAGFLFKHVCSNVPSFECGRCQKPICGQHSRVAEAMTLCIDCVKKKSQDKRWQESHHSHYHDDPYFYGDHYYDGYGYYYGYHAYNSFLGNQHHGHGRVHEDAAYMQNDPMDFTEADAESLAEEGMEDFESDINES